MVAAVIAVLFRPTQVSKRPLPLPQEPTAGTDSPRTQPRAAEPDARTTDPEPPVVKPELKPEGTPPVVVAPPLKVPRKPADNRVKTKKDKDLVEEPPPAPPPASEIGGFSQKDIPELLRMAQSDAGAGNYEKAKTEYKKVLLLQPGNQDAKDGMHRLDLIPTNQR